MKKLIFLLLFSYVLLVAKAQQNIQIGIQATSELTSNDRLTFGIGTCIGKKITTHSGFEIGFLFRKFPFEFYFLSQTGLEKQVIVAERYLTLPILYKFYSETVNFSVGPSIDFYLGWKQRENNREYDNVLTHSVSRKSQLGLLLKISKDFKMTNEIIVEPELRVNAITSMHRTYIGAGLIAKFDLK